MDSLQIALLMFAAALLPVLAFTVFYPAYLILCTSVMKNHSVALSNDNLPSVTMLIAVRNGEQLIESKISNFLALDYPKSLLKVIIFSDGSTDRTVEILNGYDNSRIQVLHDTRHIGKAASLNHAVNHADANILVFSDLDALLEPDAVRHLVAKITPYNVGGVCGMRVISDKQNNIKDAQEKYISFDSWIKKQESCLGYLTSNDGKLYAIKRQYFKPIAEGVTDDLYTALCVISQKKKFLFEPKAKALIKTPSRNPEHEISRRRRIVCRSLTGIFMHKKLFNLKEFKGYGPALFINKVLRRSLPFSLVLILLGNLLLLQAHILFLSLLALQIMLYSLAFFVKYYQLKQKFLNRAANTAFYFLLGNIGMMLGFFDYLLNKKVTKWEPIKND